MTKILNKVSKTGYILNKLKNFLPEGILLTIYNSLINPHFDYAILLWGHKAERIFKQQKKVIRHITRSKFNAHTDPLFIKLRVLKIEDLRKLSELKFYHKFTHSQLPEYFLNDFLTHNRDLHDHFTRNQSHLVTPAYPHQFARYILRVSIVETVNNFPDIKLTRYKTLAQMLKINSYQSMQHRAIFQIATYVNRKSNRLHTPLLTTYAFSSYYVGQSL